MNRIGSVALGVVCAAALTFFACDDEVTPPAPVPGDIVLTLVSPNGPEAAIVLETTDDGVLDVALVSVASAPGGGLAIIPVAGDAVHFNADGISRIVAYLETPGDIALRISVADVNQLPEFQIIEVADGANRLREPLSGYQLESVALPQAVRS